MTDRRAARQLAAGAVAAGQPLRWFEQLYSAADRDGSPVPWADHEPNPNLLSWGRLEPAAMRRQGGLNQFSVHAPQPIPMFNDHRGHLRVCQ